MMFSIVAVTSFAAGETEDAKNSFDIAVDVSSDSFLTEGAVQNTDEGVTVDFTLKIVNNPGVSSIMVNLEYDEDKLTYVKDSINSEVFTEEGWLVRGVLAGNGSIEISFLTLNETVGSSFNDCDFVTFTFKVNPAFDGEINSDDFKFTSVKVRVAEDDGSFTLLPHNAADIEAFKAHHYTAVETNAPTCEAAGNVVYECSKCDDKFTITTDPALDHDIGDWVLTTDPTCTEKGIETKSCSRCDYAETRDADPLGHDYEAVVTAPTCTEDGYTTHTCSRCQDTYKDTTVPALQHDWSEWKETKAPTTTAKGESTRTCSRCDATETQEIAKLPVITFASEEWKKGEGMTFISDAEFAAFVKVVVNGVDLSKDDYTLTKGSDGETVVVLTDEYLGTLEDGEYVIDIVSTSGTASATFEIASSSWWIILIVAAAVLLGGGGVVCVVIFLRKERENA